MKIILICIALTFVSPACRHDCLVLPEPTVFELVNTNGENVITNGTLPFSDILINRVDGNDTLTGMQYNLTNDNKVAVKELGWYNGTKNYKFWTPDTTFYFSVQSSKFNSPKCDNTYRIDNVKFTNITGSKETDFYKITIK